MDKIYYVHFDANFKTVRATIAMIHGIQPAQMQQSVKKFVAAYLIAVIIMTLILIS